MSNTPSQTPHPLLPKIGNRRSVILFFRFSTRAAHLFLANVRGIVVTLLSSFGKRNYQISAYLRNGLERWNYNEERGGLEKWKTTFPQGGQRVRLLNLMTGTDKSVPCAKFIRQERLHPDQCRLFVRGPRSASGGRNYRSGYSVCCAPQLCIELAASITRELAVNTNGSFSSRGLKHKRSSRSGGHLGELRYIASNVLPRGRTAR